jgi:hypothetical protein
VDVVQLANEEPIPSLSTTPNVVKPVATCSMSSVHVGDNSESDVENVNDKNGNFMASKHSKSESGYGNKSLYEGWKETLDNEDYDEYNTHSISEEQEAFCDALDIKFRGRRKV